MKVYLVWYMSPIRRDAALWGIYGTEEAADSMVDEIRRDYGYTAWKTDEAVQ